MSYKRYGPRTRKGRGWLTGLILFLALLIAAGAGALLWAGNQVRPDRVMPGVRVFGEDASGWDRARVRDLLRTMGYGAQGEKQFILTAFPGGQKITATLEELGLGQDLEAETDAVMAWGHTGSRTRDALNWLLGRKGTAGVFPREAEPALNEDALRDLVDRAAAELEREPGRTVVFAEEGSLEITLGTPGAHVDREALLELVRDAAPKAAKAEGDYTLLYAPEEVPAEKPDLEELHASLAAEPVNARFDENYAVQPEKPGCSFDLEAAKALLEEAEPGDTVRIPLVLTPPEVTAAELEARLFRDLLAAIDTPLTNNAVRTENIRLAASAIDDTILLPGQNFSYNAALGERTEERGYGPATSYVNGDLVEEVGGGICQLSSALYWCAMKADEVILERTNHLYYQTYVPYGMDATVSWGGPDFSFRLKDEYPVRMKAWIEGGMLRVELWGTKLDDIRVELEYEVNEVYPHKVLYLENKNVKSGTQVILDYGRDGMKVTTYRLRYSGEGELLEKVQEAVSVYASREEEIIVAPGEKPKAQS